MGVVPMRETPKHDGLLVSQLLFGEHYTVLKEKDQMVQIQLHYDQSIGWIRADQHAPISEEYFQQVNLSAKFDYKKVWSWSKKKNCQFLRFPTM